MKLQKAQRIIARVSHLCSSVDVNVRQRDTSKASIRTLKASIKSAEKAARKTARGDFQKLLPSDFSIATDVSKLTFEPAEGTIQHKVSHNFSGHTLEELRDMAEAYRSTLEKNASQISEWARQKDASANLLRLSKERLNTLRKDLRKVARKHSKAQRVVAADTSASIKKALVA